MRGRGKAWELALEMWHLDYERTGTAFVVRCHPESRVVDGRLIYSGKGPPDFMGLLSDGTSVCFDAKETESTRFSFSKLPPHQALALSRVHRLGGWAFLAVQHRVGPRIITRRLFHWGDVEPTYVRWSQGERPASLEVRAGLPIPPAGWLALRP